MTKIKKNKDVRYLNFPIALLSNFTKGEISRCFSLSKIIDYGLYYNSLMFDGYDPEIEDDFYSQSVCYLGIKIREDSMHDAEDRSFMNGLNLYEVYGDDKPMTGISVPVLLNYQDNHKTEFEDMCLLAFLALKSIVQTKPYCKITNAYWLSRMAGFDTTQEVSQLPKSIQNFNTEYYLRKIKNELEDSWGMTWYGRYTRGFYVSFKLDKKELMFQVEKKRKSRIARNKKLQEKKFLAEIEKELENKLQIVA